MDDINDEEVMLTNKLADDILAVVMESENVPPEAVISALAHVASLIAIELNMPEKAFTFCVTHAYQSVLEAEEDKEVH